MKRIFALSFCALLLSACATKPTQLYRLGSLFLVEADKNKGFNFPFFLYIPETKTQMLNLLIIPNNSGRSSEDYEFQFRSAKREILRWTELAEQTSSALLVPAFSRPNVNPPLYTHSLSRSTLEIQNGELERIDLQLVKMIETAKRLVSSHEGKPVREKVFLFGFSASAMFVNRFSFIHPELVAAVAFGAPGGWPLAPVKKLESQELAYPIGIGDFENLTGSQIKWDEIKKIPMFAFLGARDTNDSVIYRDSYTEENEKLVFALFGKTPTQRWPLAKQLYKTAGLNANFKLYEGLGHEINKQIHDEIVRFFNSIQN